MQLMYAEQKRTVPKTILLRLLGVVKSRMYLLSNAQAALAGENEMKPDLFTYETTQKS